jgi:hypothetical protein
MPLKPPQNAPPPPVKTLPPRSGEDPAAAVATRALPGGSSGDGEEEGAREMGQAAGGVDRPVPPRLGDAGVLSSIYAFEVTAVCKLVVSSMDVNMYVD